MVLNHPIKTLGLNPVRVVLHPEVSLSMIVNVARSMEEAERQARGERVGAQDDDDDEAENEEMFEPEGAPQPDV